LTNVLSEFGADLIIEVLHLSKSPMNQLVYVEENRIFFRIPAPKINLVGILGRYFLAKIKNIK
jgi:hypothetical protein